MSKDLLVEFVRESNAIENIQRDPTPAELDANERLITMNTDPTIADLKEFVWVVANAQLRSRAGMDVYVGNHRPPPGAPVIETSLHLILCQAAEGEHTPWEIHCAYESLHPFMDGNGRSGRALWAHMMYRDHGWAGLQYGFLRMFYYQTLEAQQ